jgi:hypothetical protein
MILGKRWFAFFLILADVLAAFGAGINECQRSLIYALYQSVSVTSFSWHTKLFDLIQYNNRIALMKKTKISSLSRATVVVTRWFEPRRGTSTSWMEPVATLFDTRFLHQTHTRAIIHLIGHNFTRKLCFYTSLLYASVVSTWRFRCRHGFNTVAAHRKYALSCTNSSVSLTTKVIKRWN